jgi:hypothetical protein
MIRAIGGAVGVILLVVLAGFLAQRILGSDSTSTAEAREAIEAMPFRASVHETAAGVLLGSERGGHGVVIHFAVSKEGPEPNDIPPRLIHVDRNVTGGGGFWVWDDSEIWFRRGTVAQWHEAATISVEIEEALCRKATGEACPI